MRRKKKITRHHLKSRFNGGGDQAWNILKLKAERHSIWHRLFGHKEIPEIIKLLERVQRMKDRLRKGGW